MTKQLSAEQRARLDAISAEVTTLHQEALALVDPTGDELAQLAQSFLDEATAELVDLLMQDGTLVAFDVLQQRDDDAQNKAEAAS